MKVSLRLLFSVSLVLLIASSGVAQVDDFCTEFGSTPSLNSPFANIPYIFGRISHKGIEDMAKLPRVNVILIDGDQTNKRITVGRSGNYCFRRTGGSATLIVEIDGVEAARRSVASFGASQQREDFEIASSGSKQGLGTVSADFSHPPNERTTELYKKAAKAEAEKNAEEVISVLRKIVAADGADFIAYAKLGSVYLQQKKLAESEAALRRAIELKLNYTPAWINFGLVRIAQKQFQAAAEVFKHAASLDPTSPRAFQLLGEAYLQSKQGSLGVDALNQAIKLDPIGMADVHLQLAHLYKLAGAKHLATAEYKAFLTKVPDHPDKKKFEKYIGENPPQ